MELVEFLDIVKSSVICVEIESLVVNGVPSGLSIVLVANEKENDRLSGTRNQLRVVVVAFTGISVSGLDTWPDDFAGVVVGAVRQPASNDEMSSR